MGSLGQKSWANTQSHLKTSLEYKIHFQRLIETDVNSETQKLQDKLRCACNAMCTITRVETVSKHCNASEWKAFDPSMQASNEISISLNDASVNAYSTPPAPR